VALNSITLTLTQKVFGSIPDLFKSRNKKLVSTPALRSKNKGWLD
jgi:hypothetical protein